MDDYSKILSEISDKKNLIVFAGAGIPTTTGLPTWIDLLKRLKAKIEDDFFSKDVEKASESEFPQLAQEIYEGFVAKHGDSGREKYLEALREILTPTNWSHNACQLTILDTFKHIVTTNFDSTFEKAIEAYGRLKNAEIPFQRHSLPIIDNSCFIQHERNLVYLHGNLADNVILRKEDYERYYNSENHTLLDFLKPIYKKSCLVFIGFSFNDLYFRKILTEIYSAIEKEDSSNKEFFSSCTGKASCIQHYAFLKDNATKHDTEKESFDSLCRELESIKIKVLKYKEHRDYEGWLNKVSDLKELKSASQLPWSPENG